jgi:hypothetical protein
MEASIGTRDERDYSVCSVGDEWTADRHWRQALCDIAVSLHLREHPPVDEREVEALAGLVSEWLDKDSEWGPSNTLARRLLATGRVHVETEEADRG